MKKPTWPEIEALAERHGVEYSVRELQRFTRDCVFPPDLIALFWPKASTRRQAFLQGQTRYHGSPCCSCGNTERYVSHSNCVECSRVRTQRRYHADPQKACRKAMQWARENREYLNVYNRAWSQKKREQAA